MLGFVIGALSCSVILMGCGDQCEEKVNGVGAGDNTCTGKKTALATLLELLTDCPEAIKEKRTEFEAARDSACCTEMKNWVADTMGWDLQTGGNAPFETFCNNEGKDLETCKNAAPCFTNDQCKACFSLGHMYTNVVTSNSKWDECPTASEKDGVIARFDNAWNYENMAGGGTCGPLQKPWASLVAA